MVYNWCGLLLENKSEILVHQIITLFESESMTLHVELQKYPVVTNPPRLIIPQNEVKILGQWEYVRPWRL